MVGGRYGGWLVEDLLDDRKKIWWMVRRRSVGSLEEDLIDCWKKICWIVGRRAGGWLEEDLWMDGRDLVDDWKEIRGG